MAFFVGYFDGPRGENKKKPESPFLGNFPVFEPLVGFEPTTPRLQITCVPTLGDSKGAGRTGLARFLLSFFESGCKGTTKK